MKKKFCILFVAFSLFSMAALAQSDNKKADTGTSARQVILNKTGEKNLPQQLKEKQIMEQPVMLKTDSSNITTNTVSKRKKVKCIKQKKGNK